MYANILAPLDGSDLAEHALSQAEGLAHSFSARLNLVQVISVPHELVNAMEIGTGGPPFGDVGLNLSRQLVEAAQATAQKYLENLAAKFRNNGIGVATTVLEGLPDTEILEYAREHSIDCIVVTTQGLSGIRRFLLGSVTDRIIRSSEVPVVVPPRV